MFDLEAICKTAKEASRVIGKAGINDKNDALLKVADYLCNNKSDIIKANKIDLANAEANNMSPALMDRLKLTDERIEAIAEGVRQVAALPDPIGEVLSMKRRPNGLLIGQVRVPIGVIGIIYESRPNVTIDTFALCFKSGNAVILRGGSDCINSNIALVKIVKEALAETNITPDVISLIENTDREVVNNFIKENRYLDLLIPRGGAGLINNVIQNATVPVIQTGTGNCHIYIDKSADFDKAWKTSSFIHATVVKVGTPFLRYSS